jgi:hypothetical protein
MNPRVHSQQNLLMKKCPLKDHAELPPRRVHSQTRKKDPFTLKGFRRVLASSFIMAHRVVWQLFKSTLMIWSGAALGMLSGAMLVRYEACRANQAPPPWPWPCPPPFDQEQTNEKR